MEACHSSPTIEHQGYDIRGAKLPNRPRERNSSSRYEDDESPWILYS